MPPIAFDARRIGATVEISCAIPDSAATLRYLIDREVDGARTRITPTPLTGGTDYHVADMTPPLEEVAY